MSIFTQYHTRKRGAPGRSSHTFIAALFSAALFVFAGTACAAETKTLPDTLEIQTPNGPVKIGINMDKKANKDKVCPGEEVTFTLITRMLNGLPGLNYRNVQVTDPLCPNVVFFGGDANNNNRLDFGEEFTNTCTMALVYYDYERCFRSSRRLFLR